MRPAAYYTLLESAVIRSAGAAVPLSLLAFERTGAAPAPPPYTISINIEIMFRTANLSSR